jgi:hypothetical protein
MNAAETSASRAIADCTPLAVVSRSLTTDEMETFISDVSTTSTNIAIASRTASLELPDAGASAAAAVDVTAEGSQRRTTSSSAESGDWSSARRRLA